MDELATVFTLDRIQRLHESRTHKIYSLLRPNDHQIPRVPTAEQSGLGYAVAHHFLEGAEAAAREGDQDTFTWYPANVVADRTEWYTATAVGQRIILSPDLPSLPSSVISETPYVLLGPDTTPAPAELRDRSAVAFATAADMGFAALVAGHATVVCLLRHRKRGDTLNSWTISRLPGTIFTDHVGEPAILARDLIHEAGHNWLNDALASGGVKISTNDAEFFSPWKNTVRPAFGFLHACWAFPLTMIYSARVLDRVSVSVRTFLTGYLAQQRELLAVTTDDHARALALIHDDDVRHRLDTVHRAARDL
ncbi:MAG: aKG-HExxH-type peptide beta-hydroxylase [Pseudonocardiaceae bacterium]